MKIKEEIFNLEKQLTQNEVRSSSKKIARILDNHFIENCSSGTVYHYRKGDVFPLDISIIGIQLENFELLEIAENTYLATYTAIKEYEDKKEKSLRSSIWKMKDKKLKMLFHQGTKIDA